MIFSHVGGSRHPLVPVLRILGIVGARFEDLGDRCDFAGAPGGNGMSNYFQQKVAIHAVVLLVFFVCF